MVHLVGIGRCRLCTQLSIANRSVADDAIGVLGYSMFCDHAQAPGLERAGHIGQVPPQGRVCRVCP